ncbi:MAG: DUF1365 domain-containing protein [Aestuariibacter sp.]
MTEFVSRIYVGDVYHARFKPRQHSFSYNIVMFFLSLDEVPQISHQIKHFHYNHRGWLEFRDSDYLNEQKLSVLNTLDLTTQNSTSEQRALALMSHLSGEALQGRVFLLSHLRCMGMYFSPVNFYYLQQEDGRFSHMLAEVSNTPWNERHCYIVDLAEQKDCEKVFHVSPYNPLDMTYQWRIAQPGERLHLTLDCKKETTHFRAGIQLERLTLTEQNVRKMLKRIPNMTLKTVAGIYWQALKLFVKRLPIYDHPNTDNPH